MHILIIETALTGHHPVYLENACEAYLSSGNHITIIVVVSDIAAPLLSRLKKKYGSKFEIESIPDILWLSALKTTSIRRELFLRKLFGNIFKKINSQMHVDHVFLPYLDYCLYAVGLLGSPFGATKWSGICMRPAFHYKSFNVVAPKVRFGKIKEWLFLRLLRINSLTTVHTIDELLYKQFKSKSNAIKLNYLMDPAELVGTHTYSSARKALSISLNTSVVLVYGVINSRKGLCSLIAAVAKNDLSSAVLVLVVGRLSDDMAVYVQSPDVKELCRRGSLRFIDQFIDDHLQQLVFAAADRVWLGYSGHYTMSGVLVLAGISSTKVIATRDGLIGWYTKNYDLGSTIDIENEADVLIALRIMIAEKANNDSRLDIDMTNCFKNHTWENFRKRIVE